MAQEDKGLVIRGLFLLAFIGVLVTFVLTLIFWRQQPPKASSEVPPEYSIASLVAPTVGGFPSHVLWPTVQQLSQKLPSEPGWKVRYNAAATLARRGSAEVPWPLIREMLDEKQQLRNQGERLPDGRFVYDEVTARAFTLVALKALAIWHEKQAESKPTPPAALLEIYARVDELARSPHAEVKHQAEETRKTFFRTKE
jgi:hypothetical protein